MFHQHFINLSYYIVRAPLFFTNYTHTVPGARPFINHVYMYIWNKICINKNVIQSLIPWGSVDLILLSEVTRRDNCSGDKLASAPLLWVLLFNKERILLSLAWVITLVPCDLTSWTGEATTWGFTVLFPCLVWGLLCLGTGPFLISFACLLSLPFGSFSAKWAAVALFCCFPWGFDALDVIVLLWGCLAQK